jgi:hypothetical protein
LLQRALCEPHGARRVTGGRSGPATLVARPAAARDVVRSIGRALG